MRTQLVIKGMIAGKERSLGNETEENVEIPSSEEIRQMEIRGELTHHKEDLRWIIEGMREMYVTGLEIITRGNVKRSIFEEVGICSSDLTKLSNIKELFDHYPLGWMKGSTPREVPILMGKGASTVADASATKVDTPTTLSTALVSAVPLATRPPIQALNVVFTQDYLSALNKLLEWNEKQINLLAQ
ncbi:hypothetical protein HAX54_050762 [Datura stramonium]|uniref:Uncharacterized protein n=1 Tax=Datura stramonium TaxID=4076 RepID=A0ABS8WQL8_DATST|nr:hypothetical protein [Datura stramonium]